MDLQTIVGELVSERGKLDRAIQALTGNGTSNGVEKAVTVRGNFGKWTPARRAEHRERMRKVWAAKRKAEGK